MSFRIFQFIVILTVKGFGIVNKAEIDVFLELSCFFDDSADVGNLISGSSALAKTSLNIWKFTVHVLLKPGLKNFEHYFTSFWDECNCVIVWAFFGIFLWDWNEHWPFSIVLAKKFIQVFPYHLMKIPHELFGHPIWRRFRAQVPSWCPTSSFDPSWDGRIQSRKSVLFLPF